MKMPNFDDIYIIRTAKELWQRLFAKKSDAIEYTAELEEEPDEPEDEPASNVIPLPQRTVTLDENGGEFIEEELTEDQQKGLANAASIHDILEFLPGYFEDLKALRKFDIDTYHLMAKLGGPIVPKDSTFATRTLPENFFKSAPVFRCIFFRKQDQYDEKDDCYGASIIYMLRMKGNATYVGREGYYSFLPDGICYRVVVVYNTKMGAYAGAFFVHIKEDGKVSVINERHITRQVIKKGKRRDSGGVFYKWETSLPFVIKEWIRDQRERGKKVEKPDDIAQLLCCMCLSAKRPDDAILVRASKDKIAASWTIDRRDGKRFFAKRETGYATDGKRKRILYYVGEFTRKKGDKVVSVRQHYRGERLFHWMGYKIEVSGLGFHHRDFFNANMETFEVEGPEKKNFVTIKKAAKFLQKHYSSTFHLSK